jgi:hypothetical protein
MNKRFLGLLLAGLFVFFIAGCGGRNNETVDAMAQDGTGSVFTQNRGDAAADPVGFLQSLTTDLSFAVLGIFSDTSEVFADIAESLSGEITVRGDFSFSVNVNRAQVNRWVAEFPELNEIMGLVNVLLDSGINMEVSVRMNDDMSLAGTLVWALNGERVLGLDMVMLGERFYLGIPELYNRYIAFDLSDLGLDMSELLWLLEEMDLMTDSGFDDVFGMLTPVVDILTQNEVIFNRLLSQIAQAAIGEFNNIRVNSGVTVNVNNQPLVYNEIEVTLTELELAKALNISLQLFRNDPPAVEMTADLVNAFVDLVEAPHRAAAYYITPQDVRDFINEMIDEFNPIYFDDTELLTLRILLDANTNAPRGVLFNIEGTAFRFILDPAHGYELSVVEEGERFSNRFVLRGSLNNSNDRIAGDIWIEIEDNHTNVSGRLGAFDVRYAAWDDYSIRINTSVSDWFALAGFNPNDFLIGMFADYLNNAEVILTAETANGKSHMALEIADAVNGLSIKLEMNAEENVPVTIVAPANTLSFDEIDVLLGRDLFTILGNVAALMERVEGMGYDVSMLDMLLMGLF